MQVENNIVEKLISKDEVKIIKQDYKLTEKEWKQVKEYVLIYKNNFLSKHHEVNSYITKNNLWDDFSEIRAMNDHGSNKIVEGITKKHFKLVCEILKITGGNGDPLIKSERY